MCLPEHIQQDRQHANARRINHNKRGPKAFCNLTSIELIEVGENSCRVHVGVLAYIILFITLPSFSWGPGWLSRDPSLHDKTPSQRQKAGASPSPNPRGIPLFDIQIPVSDLLDSGHGCVSIGQQRKATSRKGFGLRHKHKKSLHSYLWCGISVLLRVAGRHRVWVSWGHDT